MVPTESKAIPTWGATSCTPATGTATSQQREMQDEVISWIWKQSHSSRPRLAGTRAMPGSAGSAPHLQSNKAQLQIPPDLKDPSVPRSPCPPAPALLHAWRWDSQHSEWDSTAPHSPQHSSDRNRDRKLSPLSSARVCKPSCWRAGSWPGSAADAVRAAQG